MDAFPAEVHQPLQWYVYRLIDPRNGNTFYVGKGKGDRVFQHARGALTEEVEINEAGVMDLKNEVIREILRAQLSVLHVVHRHGLSEAVAYQVEAALIDAYPGLTNLVGGRGSSIFGCRSVEQIVAAYRQEPLVVREPLILIFIGKALDEGRDVYDAVRAAWRMSRSQAERRKLVLAYDGVSVVGAYRPRRWLQATRENFPFLVKDYPDRIGFEGEEGGDVRDQYLNRRVPPRRRGSQTAFRYFDPAKDGEEALEIEAGAEAS